MTEAQFGATSDEKYVHLRWGARIAGVCGQPAGRDVAGTGEVARLKVQGSEEAAQDVEPRAVLVSAGDLECDGQCLMSVTPTALDRQRAPFRGERAQMLPQRVARLELSQRGVGPCTGRRRTRIETPERWRTGCGLPASGRRPNEYSVSNAAAASAARALDQPRWSSSQHSRTRVDLAAKAGIPGLPATCAARSHASSARCTSKNTAARAARSSACAAADQDCSRSPSLPPVRRGGSMRHLATGVLAHRQFAATGRALVGRARYPRVR